MPLFSKILLAAYLLIGFIYFALNSTFSPLTLLALFLSSIAVIVAIIQLIFAIIDKEKIKTKAQTLGLLICSPLILFLIKSANVNQSNKKAILSAYSDGVISGADIYFYEDKSVKYCSKSLFGETCYYGNYEIEQDTFIVNYSNALPSLKYTKMTRVNDRLLFLDEVDESAYAFYIDSEFSEEIQSAIHQEILNKK